eukprot:270802_1
MVACNQVQTVEKTKIETPSLYAFGSFQIAVLHIRLSFSQLKAKYTNHYHMLEIPYANIGDVPDKVTKSSLSSIHKTKTYNDTKNDHNTIKLVNILGGIDKILSEYLSSQHQIDLTQMQLDEIHEVITSNEYVNGTKSIVYTFKTNNTFIHHIFEEQAAMKIINFIHSKITIACLLCMGVVFWIWDNIDASGFAWNASYFIYQIFTAIIATTWLIFFLLTSNIAAFLLSCKSFLVWFKILTSLKLSVIYLVLLRYFKVWGEIDASNISFAGSIVAQLDIVLFVMVCCVIDSICMSRKLKISFVIVNTLYWTSNTIFTLFSPAPNIAHAHIIITKDIYISLWELLRSSVQLLTIFFWRQTIALIRKPRRCINIKSSPIMKWE